MRLPKFANSVHVFLFKFFRFLHNRYNCESCYFNGRKQCETCKRTIVNAENDVLCVSCKNSGQQGGGGTENLEVAYQLSKRDPSSGEDVEQIVSDCNEQISTPFLTESELKIEHKMDCSNNREISFPIQDIFNCHKCDKSYSRKGHLDTHYNNIHRHTRFHCSVCAKTFVTERELNLHFESYHKYYKYICNTCGKKFCTMQGYQLHYESIHLQLFHLCDFCDKSYKSISCLRCHVSSKHEGKVYACHCGNTYRSAAALRQHRRLKDHL